MGTRLSVLLFGCLVGLFATSGTSMERTVEAFEIRGAWFDGDSIYIVGQKLNERVHMSLKDVEGTIVKREGAWLLSRVPRTGLEMGRAVDLNSGEDATGLIYRDHDLSVAMTPTGVTVTGRSQTVARAACADVTWSNIQPVRVGDELLYCGSLYGVGGELIANVPASMVTKRSTESASANSPAAARKFFADRFVAVLSAGHTLVSRVDATTSIASLDFADWKNGGNAEVSFGRQTLNASDYGYRIENGAIAYSPSAFLLRPVRDASAPVLLCSLADCAPIKLRAGYAYVLVDGERKQLITIERKDAAASGVRVRAVDY